MDDRFVTLASLVVRPAEAVSHAARTPEAASPSTPPVITAPAAPAAPTLDAARADIVREFALMRAAAAEAFERATVTLLTELARDVLARELALRPADVAALVLRANAAFADYEPVGFVVAPSDAPAFASELPVRTDASLDAGDLLVDLRDGTFESRFTLRVAETVARVAAVTVR